MPPDVDTAPGLRWSARLRQPKHAATVELDGDDHVARCPLCGEYKVGGYRGSNRSAAMVSTLNHRNEYH